MRDGMFVLQTYLNELDAEIFLGRLKSLGIEGELETDNCGGMRPHLDLTVGVRVLVPEADRQRAEDALADMQTPDPSPAWACPACGEQVDAGFSTCWNCGRDRP